MSHNERMENRGNSHGGYAGKNSNPGGYRGGKGGNNKPPRGNKKGNSGGRNVGGTGKSSFASPEMKKAVYLTGVIPLAGIVSVVLYFGGHAAGWWA